MNDTDIVRRSEIGLNKVILYSRSSRQLLMIDPQTAGSESAREVPPQKPAFPGTLSAPLKVFFSITRQCNLDCSMCFTRDKTFQQPILSAEAIRDLVAALGKVGVLEIRLTGGEPTIHPDFFKLVEWIEKAGMNTSLNTHGVYSPRKLARLLESPVRDFHISLDGPADVHEYLRGSETFERSLTSIRALRAAGKRVRINTMVFRQNTHLLEDMIRLAEALKAPIRFCLMRAIGRAKAPGFADKHILTLQEWGHIKNELTGLATHARVQVIYFSNDEIEDFNTCEGRYASLERAKCGPWLTQMGIDSEGEVYAGGCIDDIPKSLSVGSVLRTPVSELWARASRYARNDLLPRFPRCAQCCPESLWMLWSEQLSRQPTRSIHHF